MSPEDLNYLQSLDADKKAKHKVTRHLFHFLAHPDITRNRNTDRVRVQPLCGLFPLILSQIPEKPRTPNDRVSCGGYSENCEDTHDQYAIMSGLSFSNGRPLWSGLSLCLRRTTNVSAMTATSYEYRIAIMTFTLSAVKAYVFALYPIARSVKICTVPLVVLYFSVMRRLLSVIVIVLEHCIVTDI